MKKAVSALLSIVIIMATMFPINNIMMTNVSAKESVAEYSGLYNGRDFKFKIYDIDYDNGTFIGYIYIDNEFVKIDQPVNGKVTLNDDNYVCTFNFSYSWFITTYDALFYIAIYPEKGEAIGNGGGGILFADTDFPLTGSVDQFFFSYSENDMKLCMDLSSAIYKDEQFIPDKNSDNKTYSEIIISNLSYIISKYEKVTEKEENQKIVTQNTKDVNPDNVCFAILKRINESTSTIDIIVVIRGTFKEEWNGNVQITGASYNEKQKVHDNFNKAKDSIKSKITNYYNNYSNKYENINLIITGHSRGAAVANLYAKEATDVMNGVYIDNIPVFDNVTAYTFACPNVEKYNDKMTDYRNIYNFWFKSDIVPTVPLSSPTEGWGYWKYGKCYTMDISDYYVKNIGSTDNSRIAYFCINPKIINDEEKAFSQWQSVDDYYNKHLKTINPFSDDYTTLFNFLNEETKLIFGSNKQMGTALLRFAKNSKELLPLINFAILNIYTIKTSHHFNTYNEIINGSSAVENTENDIEACGSEYFKEYTYEDAVSDDTITERSNKLIANSQLSANAITLPELNIYEIQENSIEYNFTEMQKLKFFAQQNDNNDILGWDLDDPGSWKGVTWNSSGHVTKIDFNYLWLSGNIDCSNFTYLSYLDLYGNSLTSINLDNDSALTYLNCSYNNLSASGLDLTDCVSLIELYCDSCGLTTINLSNLTELQSLSCSFNNLIALDVSFNQKLNYISCLYNYLDFYNDSSLLSQFDNMRTTNNAYVNYYPQLISEDSVINSQEIQLLENFAKFENNNEYLDWLDNDGNVSLRKLQYYARFEYNGSEYRIVELDVSNLDIEGSLDLSSFDCLKELYCNDTSITSLNLNNCNNLEKLYCENSDISSLTLPIVSSTENSKLSELSCQNNKIDINIFTDDIVSNIKSKADYVLSYRHQIIDEPVSAFDADDYNILVDFANQLNNQDLLNWDLTTPGNWNDVNWIKDAETGKYKLLECYFDCLDVSGNLDLTSCDAMKTISISGSNISTVSLPPMDVDDYAFYDCKKLEAVILTGGSSIGESAFKFCPVLQGVYIPDSINSISQTAFEGLQNVTVAGNSSSYAESYCSSNGIPFESGYFICGNIVTKENNSGTYEHCYPVEDVSVSGTTAVTDQYGYFVIFGLSKGEYSYNLNYDYGYDLSLDAVIDNSPAIITTPIGMVSFDWNNDGYINAKDYSMLIRQINGENTGIDAKYYDINKDGVVNRDDWIFVKEFFLTSDNEEIQDSYEGIRYAYIPSAASAAFGENLHIGIEDLEGTDD